MIIENTVLQKVLEIKTDKTKDERLRYFLRYVEAIDKMISETTFELKLDIKVNKISNNKIGIRIVI